MTKKTILLGILLALLTTMANAQGVEFFISTLPNKYLPQLEQSQRQVLLNNYRNKKDSSINNTYGGKSRLLIYDEEKEYIRINLSQQGNLAAKKFTMSDGESLFALCTWTCSPACDGDLSFFKGSNLTPTISKNFIPNLYLKDFFILDSLTANNINADKLEESFDILFIRYEVQQQSDTILAILGNETYIGEKSFEKWKRRMKGDRIPLVWENDEFKIGEAFFEKK